MTYPVLAMSFFSLLIIKWTSLLEVSRWTPLSTVQPDNVLSSGYLSIILDPWDMVRVCVCQVCDGHAHAWLWLGGLVFRSWLPSSPSYSIRLQASRRKGMIILIHILTLFKWLDSLDREMGFSKGHSNERCTQVIRAVLGNPRVLLRYLLIVPDRTN